MTGGAITAFGLDDADDGAPDALAQAAPTSAPTPETPPDHEPRTDDVTAIQAPAPSAWSVANEARRETARGCLAAVTRSEALHAAGAPWAEADRAAGAEAGVSAPTVAA